MRPNTRPIQIDRKEIDDACKVLTEYAAENCAYHAGNFQDRRGHRVPYQDMTLGIFKGIPGAERMILAAVKAGFTRPADQTTKLLRVVLFVDVTKRGGRWDTVDGAYIPKEKHITLELSPDMPMSVMIKEPWRVANLIRPRLMHEVTHALDPKLTPASKYVRAESRERLLKKHGLHKAMAVSDAQWGQYVNQPDEVRAFMQECAVDCIDIFEAQPSLAELGAGRAIPFALELSPSWRDWGPLLTRANKELVLKGVTRALQDADLI